MKYTTLVPVPERINIGVLNAKQCTMLDLLGQPRMYYGGNDTSVTNPQIKRLLVTKDVGEFKVTGLAPAVFDLENILAKIKLANPDLYSAIGTAGMTCARLVRGTKHGSVSNHSWGTAIDLTLDGVLDIRGDDKIQVGLIDIAKYFNSEGWYWGAGFGTEDAMHFEVGDARIREYCANKWCAGIEHTVRAMILQEGDRGPEVRKLQTNLVKLGVRINIDGDFGAKTKTALARYQSNNKLPVKLKFCPTGLKLNAVFRLKLSNVLIR